MNPIEEKAITIAKKHEERRIGKEPEDVRGQKLGYDLEARDRKIEVKGTEAKKPNKAGDHVTLLPNQHKILKRYPDYWIYRVYNVSRKGKEKVVPIPQNVILEHLKPYTVRRLSLTKKEWEQLEKQAL